MKYSERIRNLREDRELSQSDVAKTLQTTYQYYSTYESGKRELPFSRAIELARFYNVSLDYIAGISNNPTPQKLNQNMYQEITDKTIFKAYKKADTKTQKIIKMLLNMEE